MTVEGYFLDPIKIMGSNSFEDRINRRKGLERKVINLNCVIVDQIKKSCPGLRISSCRYMQESLKKNGVQQIITEGAGLCSR